MRPFYDDYDELDDFGFEGFPTTRRRLNEKQQHQRKASGRKRQGRSHLDRWADYDPGSWDEGFDDMDDDYDRH